MKIFKNLFYQKLLLVFALIALSCYGFAADKYKSKTINGNQYYGEIKKGKPHGYGTMTYADHGVYNGFWENGIRQGKGTYKTAWGDEYQGNWNGGTLEGDCLCKYYNGDVYQGKVDSNLKKSGEGSLSLSKGGKFIGMWKEDQFHGEGEYNYDGTDSTVVMKGVFQNGKLFNGEICREKNKIYEYIYVFNGTPSSHQKTSNRISIDFKNERFNKALFPKKIFANQKDTIYYQVHRNETNSNFNVKILNKQKVFLSSFDFENPEFYWYSGTDLYWILFFCNKIKDIQPLEKERIAKECLARGEDGFAAARYYFTSADTGESNYELYLIYSKGLGIPANQEIANKYLQNAVKMGCSIAKTEYYRKHFEDSIDNLFISNYEDALLLTEELANQGHQGAKLKLQQIKEKESQIFSLFGSCPVMLSGESVIDGRKLSDKQRMGMDLLQSLSGLSYQEFGFSVSVIITPVFINYIEDSYVRADKVNARTWDEFRYKSLLASNHGNAYSKNVFCTNWKIVGNKILYDTQKMEHFGELVKGGFIYDNKGQVGALKQMDFSFEDYCKKIQQEKNALSDKENKSAEKIEAKKNFDEYQHSDLEEKPSFNGGDVNGFAKWVNSRLIYPQIAKENGVQGRVILQFTIDIDGSVTGVKVLRGVDPSLDKEAIRVVSSSPKWIPGFVDGEPIRVTYTFPIIFQFRD